MEFSNILCRNLLFYLSLHCNEIFFVTKYVNRFTLRKGEHLLDNTQLIYLLGSNEIQSAIDDIFMRVIVRLLEVIPYYSCCIRKNKFTMYI